MVKKLSEKQFTNISDDTFTVYFNYNLLDRMENAVVLTWVQNLKLWILEHWEVSKASNCMTQRNPWILANKINH